MNNQSSISKPMWWTGTIVKGLMCLFLLFDAIMKLVKNPQSVEATTQLGLPENCIQFLGAYLLMGTVLYAYGRTVMAGSFFLVAYLGGAAAITYRAGIAGHPYVFPVVFAVFVLLAEFLRNRVVRDSITFI